ncbi:ankyrin repeat domain-containing protein [Lysobacter solisilvae (ex Woo and Kim 2020)]|uniref:Ankyrin repeat domain-containing protein n=1 Tax=Agrilutibacter terrestris TaxID=2865112 RepID=A0A7H0FU58_9GAMM|nr:ankyrin repeat domain-containing protein [Lysobacter terrestris]QNP39574.1 ankyrin repeat domain-containing protein [Lysobacter terrestris]
MPEAIAAPPATESAAAPAVVARTPSLALAWASLAAGVALAALSGLGGVAAIAALLAQPAFALAVAQLRGREFATPKALLHEAGWLALLWAGAAVLTLAVVAWPLSALTAGGSLPAALGLSFMAGVVLLGLWRLWPLWHGMETEGGLPMRHWRELGELDAGAWRGFGVAAIVTMLLGAIVLLAWPGLLGSAARWALAGSVLLASPLLHWLLQRTAAADALPEPEIVAETDADAASELPLSGLPLEAELYAAARAGRVEQALQLIDAGADVHAPPPQAERDQRSLAVLAAVLPDLRLLRALIARGSDLNAAHAGMTPLLAATRDSWHGRPDAVMTLLANGADPRAVDFDGNTALHHAARSSDPGVAALLRDAAAEIDVLNVDGLSPLGVACAAGNWRLAKFLLERGARPEPVGGQPALLAAAGTEEDDAAGVQLLLKQKAKADARDAHGRSALHEAAFAGHAEIVEVLLAAGADPAASDRLGRTPVLEAARGGRLAVLERLLTQLPKGGANEAAAADAHGRGALMLAAMSENATPALIERLLALGLDAEMRDFDDKRAIDRAAEAGRWALVAALDRAYPLPSAVSDTLDSPDAPLPDRAPAALLREGLHERRGNELDGLAQLLGPLELGALLHDEAPAPSPEQVERLLRWGADAGVRDGRGDTPLFALLVRGPSALPALQTLLRRGVSPAGSGGLARFLAACSASEQAARGLEYFALDLLERGADPFAPSPAGDPPLALAVRLGWSRLVDRLLAIGVSLDGRDSHGMSALHLAAALGREAMLKKLVAQGAAPDLLAADGQTPLGVALSSGRRDLADWLDWRGWPLPKRPLRASDVPAAAIVGDADAVRRLLDLGLPVDACDSQGCSALLRAAGGGHRAVVDLLLARGADPQLAAHSGATPLSAAVSMRHVEVVDRLIAAGVSLEQRLPGDLTVLMVACALGLPDMAARLLSAGGNVHATDAQGRTALHCAAMFGFTARERARLVALLDTLLLAGAEADLPAAGATPLLLLLGARAEPGSAADEDVLIAGIDQLLDHDARLDAQDPRGFGPLHLAALHGLMRVVLKLLRAGADPSQRDTLNRPPREIAVMRGFVDIAAELVPTPAAPGGGDVSMARFLRER